MISQQYEQELIFCSIEVSFQDVVGMYLESKKNQDAVIAQLITLLLSSELIMSSEDKSVICCTKAIRSEIKDSKYTMHWTPIGPYLKEGKFHSST